MIVKMLKGCVAAISVLSVCATVSAAELVDNPRQLRWLLRAYVAGSWVLAAITLANFASPEAVAAGQVRFYAEGLDPNDTARFLDLAFPLAALLVDGESRWHGKLLALGYFPLGLLAVLLTASRGGFVAAVLAVAGSAALLVSVKPKRVVGGLLAVPVLSAVLWWIVPLESLERLATIYEQLDGGNLNERVNIWVQGWQAFVRAPIFGTGAGSFVAAAGLAPSDTAHNTALSIVVGGGLCALALFAAILVLAIESILKLRGPLLWALATASLVLLVTSLTAAVEESRNTWLLLALIAVAGRLAVESSQSLSACFPARARHHELAPLHPQSI